MRRFGRVELLGSWTLCSEAEQFVDELELALDMSREKKINSVFGPNGLGRRGGSEQRDEENVVAGHI